MIFNWLKYTWHSAGFLKHDESLVFFIYKKILSIICKGCVDIYGEGDWRRWD